MTTINNLSRILNDINYVNLNVNQMIEIAKVYATLDLAEAIRENKEKKTKI